MGDDLKDAIEALRSEVANFPPDDRVGIHFAEIGRAEARALLSFLETRGEEIELRNELEQLRAAARCDDCTRTVELGEMIERYEAKLIEIRDWPADVHPACPARDLARVALDRR